MEVEVEERLSLVPLLWILLAYSDHLPEDLDVKALTLPFRIQYFFFFFFFVVFFLFFVTALDLLLNVLDPLDKGTQPITRNPTWSRSWFPPGQFARKKALKS